LAAILSAGAGFDHRVQRIVVGEGAGLEVPLAGLRQRVALGVGVVDLRNAVQVLAVQPITALVFVRHQTECCRPHEAAIKVFMSLPGGGVLVGTALITRQVLQLFSAQHQHAVVAACFNFCRGGQGGE
jgi:hypothetical protein